MSFEIIKKMKIEGEGERVTVTLDSVSNNVSPRKYHKSEFTATKKDIFKYYIGNIWQANPSANNYAIEAALMYIKRKAQKENVSLLTLYNEDIVTDIFNEYCDKFFELFNRLDSTKAKKYIVMFGSYYITKFSISSAEYSQNKDKAMKFNLAHALYIKLQYAWTDTKIFYTEDDKEFLLY